MGRQIFFDILLNFPQGNGNATGRFQNRDRNAQNDDNSQIWTAFDASQNRRVQLPELIGGRIDSTLLLKDDNITVRIGEKRRQPPNRPAPPRQLQNLQVAVTVGRALDRGSAQENGSPFGAAGNPVGLFLGTCQGGQPSPTMGFSSQTEEDKDGSDWVIDFYTLPLGPVTEQVLHPNQPSKYSIMVGAIAQTAQGQYSFGHDPEVDVGTDQMLAVAT